MSSESSPRRLVKPNTNRNWSTPDNVISLNPVPDLRGGFYDSPTSGGTSGILDAFRTPPHRLPDSLAPKLTPEQELLNNHPLNQPSFDANVMMQFLDGGKVKMSRRKFIQSPTKRLDFMHKYNASRPESIYQHLKLFTDIHDKYMTKMVPSRDDIASMTTIAAHTGTLANHYGLGVNTILNAANDDQRDEWLPPALQTQIIVSYAQTELKHGSNVRGLQTTAEYLHDHNVFVINSNNLGGYKWWPGGLGCTSTHALVYANLIIKNIDYGVHSFFVQVRDENHRPLPGIIIGDNGNCIGDFGNDTGFLGLENVVIPKFNMLAKFQWVDDNGDYIKSEEKVKNPRLHYLTMMMTRAGMVQKQSGILSRGVTIALRYSYVRTQGFMNRAVDLAVKKVIDTNTDQNGGKGVLVDLAVNGNNINNINNINQNNNTMTQSSTNISTTDPTTMFPDLHALIPSPTPGPLSQQLRLPLTSIPHLWRQHPLPLISNSNNTKIFPFQAPEYPIIEYSPQRSRIFKQLSQAYILKSTGKYMIDIFNNFTGGESMGASTDNIDLTLLSDIAPLTAGLKAVTTSMTHQGLLDLRESLGGNGYLMASGIGDLWLTYCWETTAEGERVPMLLQCGRHIMKSLDGVVEAYLNKVSGWGMERQGNSGNNNRNNNNNNNNNNDSTPSSNNSFLSFSPSNEYLKSMANQLISTISALDGDSKNNNNISTQSNKNISTTTSPSSTNIPPLPDLISVYELCFTELYNLTMFPSPQSPPPTSPQEARIYTLLHHVKDTTSPLFLLYLIRLSQYKAMALWLQVLQLYCTQLIFATEVFNTNNKTDFTPIQLHSASYTTPHQEIIFNSMAQLLLLATEQHCKTFMFSCFVSQLFALHAFNHNNATHRAVALHLTKLDGAINPFQSNLEQQVTDMVPKGAKKGPNDAKMAPSDVKMAPNNSTNDLPQGHNSPQSAAKCPFSGASGGVCPMSLQSVNRTPVEAQEMVNGYLTLIPVLTKIAIFWVTNEYLSDTPVQPDSMGLMPISTGSQSAKNKGSGGVRNKEGVGNTITNKIPNLMSYSLLSQLNTIASNQLISDGIALCDAFDIADSVLASIVGQRDGNFYESLFQNALLSDNNQSSPWSEQGYNDIFANRLDVDMLVGGKEEQDMLYEQVFKGKRGSEATSSLPNQQPFSSLPHHQSASSTSQVGPTKVNRSHARL